MGKSSVAAVIVLALMIAAVLGLCAVAVGWWQ